MKKTRCKVIESRKVMKGMAETLELVLVALDEEDKVIFPYKVPELKITPFRILEVSIESE